VSHDHDMVRLGSVLAEYLFEPLELLAGHPGRNLALLALALLEHVYRDEQSVFVKPVKGSPIPAAVNRTAYQNLGRSVAISTNPASVWKRPRASVCAAQTCRDSDPLIAIEVFNLG
jgi:hypothetical protein